MLFKVVSREDREKHFDSYKIQGSKVKVGQSLFEVPSQKLVQDVLDMLPDGHRLMKQSGFDGDRHFKTLSPYLYMVPGQDMLRRYASRISEANEPSGEDLDDESIIYPFDPIIFIRSSVDKRDTCPDCEGQGEQTCVKCDGDGCGRCDDYGSIPCSNCSGGRGWLYGTMITVAKDQDDWWWVAVTKYSDLTNPDYDYDPVEDELNMFKCDQLTGLREFFSSKVFKDSEY
jgi:hypothetical protein